MAFVTDNEAQEALAADKYLLFVEPEIKRPIGGYEWTRQEYSTPIMSPEVWITDHKSPQSKFS